MKIKTFHTTEKETEIPVPSFFISEDESHAVAVLDENTIVAAKKSDLFSYVQNGSSFIMSSDLKKIVEDGKPCTEEKFFEVYDKIQESMSLSPILKTIAV